MKKSKVVTGWWKWIEGEGKSRRRMQRDTHTEAPGQKQGCSWPGGWSERGQRSEHPLGLRSSHGTVLHPALVPSVRP